MASLTQRYALAFKLVQPPAAQHRPSASFKTIDRGHKDSFTKKVVPNMNDLVYDVRGYFSQKYAKIGRSKSNLKIELNVSQTTKNEEFEEQEMQNIRDTATTVPPLNTLTQKIMSGFHKNGPIHRYKNSKSPPNKNAHSIPNSTPQLPKITNLVSKKSVDYSNDHKNGIVSGDYKVKNLFRNTGVITESRAVKYDANPETCDDKHQQVTDNKFGLCGYEYDNTIQGKIVKKYSHNLDFSKKPMRPPNMNKIWYSKDKLISAVDWQGQHKDLTHRVHSFRSNSNHQLYSTLLNKDKITNNLQVQDAERESIERGEKLVRKRSDKGFYSLQKMKSRQPLNRQQYISKLDYHQHKQCQLLDDKKPLLMLSRIQRKLSIPKQVISPEKGCYR